MCGKDVPQREHLLHVGCVWHQVILEKKCHLQIVVAESSLLGGLNIEPNPQVARTLDNFSAGKGASESLDAFPYGAFFIAVTGVNRAVLAERDLPLPDALRGKGRQGSLQQRWPVVGNEEKVVLHFKKVATTLSYPVLPRPGAKSARRFL